MNSFKLYLVLLLILLVGFSTRLSSESIGLDNILPVSIGTRYQCFSAENCQEDDINLMAVAESCNSAVNLQWKYIIRNVATEEIIQYSYNYMPEPNSGIKAGNILDELDETIEARLHIIEALEIGNYKVSWTLIDHLGNISQRDHYFDVVDNEAPIPNIIQIANESYFQEGLTAISFDRGMAFEGLISSFDNCSDKIYFSYSPILPNILYETEKWEKQLSEYGKYFFDPNNGNISTEVAYLEGTADAWIPDQNTSQRTYSGWCNYYFNCSNSSTIKIYVWDNFANIDDCDDNNYSYGEVYLSIDCECDSTKLSGFVTGHQNYLPLQKMTMKIDNGEIYYQTETDTNGYYEFDLLPDEYYIEAYKNSDYINGITTLDIIHIQKYLLGIKNITDPLKLISADVNSDNSISASDILDLRKLILGVTDTLRNNSWIGIPRDYIFENPEKAFQEVDEIKNNIVFTNGDDFEFNFSAIKIGDLNYSADAVNSRDYEIMSLILDNQEIEKGKLIKVPFYAKDFKDVYGIQLNLSFTNLEFIDVEPHILNINYSNYHVKGNNLTLSWNNPIGVSLDNNEVLFEISFESRSDGKLNHLLSLNSESIKPEIYAGNDLKINNLKLEFRNNPKEYTLHQNEPNPFHQLTTIKFNLPQDDIYDLTIFDITGKIILQYRGIGKEGENRFAFDKTKPSTNHIFSSTKSTILFYKLQSGSFVSIKKMISYNW